MDAVQELVAREHVRDVKARYCRFLDCKAWDEFGALFTEDATLDVREDTGSEPIQGRAAIVETVRRVVQHAKTAHQVHSPEIVFDGADAADVTWAMQDRVVWEPGKSPIPPAQAITGYGHYRERYIRRDGRWQIASLRLTRLLVEVQN